MKRFSPRYCWFVLLLMYSATLNAFEFDEIGVIDIRGYISQGYLYSDANNYFLETEKGSYDFKEVGVSFSTDVSGGLRLSIQFLSYLMGDFGSDNFRVNWATADYTLKDWFSLKAGKLKIFHGIYNRNRDADFLRTCILLPQSVYNESWRSTIAALDGLEIYGTKRTPLGRFGYNFQTGGISDIEPDSGVALAAKEQLVEQAASRLDFQLEYIPTDVKEDKAYVGRLLWMPPIMGFSVNVTGWQARADIIGTIISGGREFENTVLKTDSQSYTGSIEFRKGAFHFITEYSLSIYESEYMGNIVNIDAEGYYANIIYRFTDWFEAGAYHSEYYADRDDMNGRNYTPSHSAWQKDSCLSFRFDMSNNWVLKFEGHYIYGTAIILKSQNMIDFDLTRPDLKSEWMLFGMKLTFSF